MSRLYWFRVCIFFSLTNSLSFICRDGTVHILIKSPEGFGERWVRRVALDSLGVIRQYSCI